MGLKITGGFLKGRSLLSLPKSQTRPTISMLRQALFNILQNQIEGRHFLDLFAGSGIMGIEALSRGAESAIFVESNRAVARKIDENLEKFNLKDRAFVLALQVLKALPVLQKKQKTFDLVYIDPPYDLYEKEKFLEKLLFALYAHNLLKPKTLVFIEMPQRFEKKLSSLELQNWSLKELRKYGNALLGVFVFKTDQA